MSTREQKEITGTTRLVGTTAGIALSLLIGGTLIETFTLLWQFIFSPPAILVFPEILTIIYLIIPCIIVGGYIWVAYWFYLCRFVGCFEYMGRCFPIWSCRWVKIYVPVFVIWCVIVRIILVAAYPSYLAWLFVP
ncbi:MAG: hypothetical protein JSW61_08140 [Candidatus Thorarchaeota archaeon]|nr:MAG: hypothetical protein JSW61_08140 [Candidatus Thorarchaeota archaeon]